MNLFRQHPATQRLLRQRAHAKLIRTLQSFRSPRRALLSLFAFGLSVIWISQAIAGVFFREPADPIRLSRWLTLGLTGFALWNLVKITFRKPVEPFEWTDAEKEWLGGSPLTRGQLIRYRVCGISAAAMFKATIFVVVMIPDLHHLALGFVGLYLGLMIIELMRMGMEVVVYRITTKQRIILQTFAAALILSTIVVTGFWYLGQWRAGQFVNVVSLSFMRCTQQGLQLIPDTQFGSVLCAPFGVLAGIMLADTWQGMLGLKILLALVTVMAMIRGLESIDSHLFEFAKQTEKSNWNKATRIIGCQHQQDLRKPDRRAPRGGAMGAMVWRQFNGVRHYLGTVLFALSMPMFFALGPAFGTHTDWKLVQVMIFTLGFWSFFLLPAALKFDFRRDLNRVNVLKSLPMKPIEIAIAQLAVPVAITTVFQMTTLLVAMMINPFPPGYLLVAMAILVPFNVFVYALENLIFLLYPYRITEESIQMFLRTILSFTAKGILLGIIAAVGMLLLLASIMACRMLPLLNPQAASLVLFSIAAGSFGLLGSGFVVWLLARAFERIDPSQDLSAIQL